MTIKQHLASEDFQVLKEIIVLFAGWRIILFFLALFGLSILPQTIAPGQLGWATPEADYFLKWANWDGGHFRGIAENGYLSFQVVFFPLYPLLIKALMLIRIPSLWGGLLISNLSIIGALFYLYKLVEIDFDKLSAKKAVFIALSFPTAFYFGAVYSESLFLLLVVAAFYCSRKKLWFLAFTLAGLATVTRLGGVVALLALAIEYFLKTSSPPSLKELWTDFLIRVSVYLVGITLLINITRIILLEYKLYLISAILSSVLTISLSFTFILLLLYALIFCFKKMDYRRILSWPMFFLVVALIPFAAYGIYLYFTQSNFFAFVAHEQLWHRSLTMPWDGPISYFKNLLSVGFFRIGGTSQALLEFIFFTLFLILLVISYFKLRLSYTVFFALSLFLPLSSGTLIAIHRYGLVIFPVFILLSLIKNETYYNLWIFFSLTMLGVLTVLFINSYWVS